MLADTIKKIERKYEIKRGEADAIFLSEKKAIYSSTPRLSEIDKEITKKGIQTARLSITGDSDEKESTMKKLQNEILDLKKEKEKILADLHVTLAPKYSCSKCNDTGYIIHNDGKSEMCSCMKQELINEAYHKSNLHNLKDQTFDNFNLDLFSDKANKEKYGFELSPRENMEEKIKIAKNFIENFENPETKNLLFTGTAGTGKTYLSSCIANELMNQGYSVLYQISPVLLDNVMSYKYDNHSSKELYENLFDVNLLVIDDLGIENASGAKFTEIFTILNTRMLKPNTKTIISTNFTLKELSKIYDTRIMSRLIGSFDILGLFGNDLRLR